MKIGIDARELAGHPTGVGRYLAGLLRQWTPSTTHEFLLYSHAPLEPPDDGSVVRLIQGAGGTAWEQVALRRAIARDRVDVLFSPGYTAPLLTNVASVVAVHDVSFVAHPEWFRPREGARRRFLCRRAARRARAVVTISEFSRREIGTHLGVAADRVHVIPPGIDRPAATAAPATATPRVLYVGSLFNRRRLPDLVAAFAQVAARHPETRLDLVGDDRTHPHQDIEGLIARQGLTAAASWRRYVSDETLAGLYQAARAFAFLSEYEGLGLTPLEALSVGVPPVLLDTAVARESCGDAALYVARGDIQATAAALEQILFDDATRQRLLAAAPAVLAGYSWPAAADATLRVIEDIA